MILELGTGRTWKSNVFRVVISGLPTKHICEKRAGLGLAVELGHGPGLAGPDS